MEWEAVKALADRVLADKRLTRQEMDELIAAVAADHYVSAEENQLLESIKQKVLRGEIKLDA